MTRTITADFLHRLIVSVLYTIHTDLTDSGVQFSNHPHYIQLRQGVTQLVAILERSSRLS